MNRKEVVEQQVNTLYKTLEPAVLHITEPEVAQINLRVSAVHSSLIFLNEMETNDKDLYFDLERTDSLVMMYFQLQGSTHFIDNSPFKVPARHHSLNYLPSFRSKCQAVRNSRIKNLCIKITPNTILNEWPDEITNHNLLRAIQNQEPLVTLHESRFMNHNIAFNVRQVIDCPYTGELGNCFRLSLIRLLLIQQLAEFTPIGTSKVSSPPHKLSATDIAALHDLKQYLEKHFLEDFSLDKLARRAGLNNFKLKYGFRTLFNSSVMKYIDELKMEYARQVLLDNQHADRFDISDALGYNHYSNFSAAFKKHFGESPSSYKKYLSHTN